MHKTAAAIVIVMVLLGSSVAAGADDGGTGKEEKDLLARKYLIPGETNILTEAAVGGTWDGEFGMQFRSEEHDDDEFTVDGEPENSASAGWGYLEISWLSGPIYDTQLGLGGLAVTEMWKDDGFDGSNDIFDEGGTFADHAKWTQVYLKHNVSDKTYVVAGRAEGGLFGEPASGDGDFYQGIGVTTEAVPRVRLRVHAVNEWMNNASPSWDFGGIETEWAELSQGSLEIGEDVAADTSSEFGSFAYTGMAEIEAITDLLTVTPYVQHHSNVATSVGASFNAEHPVNSLLTLGLNGAWVTHLEDTPDELWPHDEDFQQRLIHAYGKVKGLQLGLGYYSISDDRIIFNGPPGSGQFERDFKDTFVMDEFDPMEEDIGKYGEQQGGGTIFADAGYSCGPFSLEVIYGVVDGAAAAVGNTETDDGAGSELNVTLGVDVAKNLEAELFYADIQDDFADDGESGFDMLGGAISYSF